MNIFSPTDDTPNLVCRRVCGKIQMGLTPTLYGVRVKAGLISDIGFNLDWCAGAEQEHIEWLYAAMLNILEHSDLNAPRPFGQLPTASTIKPYWGDQAFLNNVFKRLQQPVRVVPLPTRTEIISRFYDKNTPLLVELGHLKAPQ